MKDMKESKSLKQKGRRINKRLAGGNSSNHIQENVPVRQNTREVRHIAYVEGDQLHTRKRPERKSATSSS